jgi:hypothetical protein
MEGEAKVSLQNTFGQGICIASSLLGLAHDNEIVRVPDKAEPGVSHRSIKRIKVKISKQGGKNATLRYSGVRSRKHVLLKWRKGVEVAYLQL